VNAELDPEDAKIITLARSARARNGAASGAAVRDETGRTYAGAAVNLPSLTLDALHVAVAMAISSGAESLEAAAVVSAGEPTEDVLAVAWDLKAARVLLAGVDGAFVKSYENPGR
jgi:hypothetical protein